MNAHKHIQATINLNEQAITFLINKMDEDRRWWARFQQGTLWMTFLCLAVTFWYSLSDPALGFAMFIACFGMIIPIRMNNREAKKWQRIWQDDLDICYKHREELKAFQKELWEADDL